ncbi:hypothetical protein MLD38_010116 [Melastoma candidum]|uniref:Uncharacterized protein n=1 Tax=Melastoma candidum TaxID=119954 RepID=A0ACB9R763_9MYRT|nr:hypothetical protein MLD38_010116 [Melastoma candidum]
MVEFGKRPRPHRGPDNDARNPKRRLFDGDLREERIYDGDELVVYRILCPAEVMGSVIGKAGKVINTIRQDTRAKVKVVDPFPGAKDRVVLVYCYVKEKVDVDDDHGLGDYDRPLCAAQDALLRVHTAIVKSLASAREGDGEMKRGGGGFGGENGKVECQILVPASQSANIIGKAGATIKKLRSRTKTYIKILAKDMADPTHSCAMDFDNFVIINGEPEAVKKALNAVSSIMYKFGPKEEIPLVTSISEPPPSIIIPSDIPIFPSGTYGSIDPIMPSGSVPPILGATHMSDLHNYGDKGNFWSVYASTLSVLPVTGQSEELIVRLLCPSDKIGRVIGKAGSTIKSIRQASGAHIEVDDSKNDYDDCIIIIRATEAQDDLKSMAVEAMLLLQTKINDEDDEFITIRLLIPSRVIGCIIGRSGSIINEIRKMTLAEIRISKGKKTRSADANDELVEVSGEVAKVRDALIQIVLRLRDDVLKNREEGHRPSGGLETLGSGLSMHSSFSSFPPTGPLSHDKKPGKSFSGLYGYGSLSLGDGGYGALPSYSSKFEGFPPPSTLEILIPANAVSKVLGRAGANLDNIRKISGASVVVSEPKSILGDRIAYISGTPVEKCSAENLVQAFIMAT